MTIAWELSGAGGTQPLSDHLPLRGDFNRWALLGVRSYVKNLQPNIYSAAEPNATVDDTDPEWFVPRSGNYLCKGVNPAGSGGLCALPEEWLGSSARLNGNLAHIMYSDDGQGNEDDADYKAILRYCLVHEYFEAEGTQSALDVCRNAGYE